MIEDAQGTKCLYRDTILIHTVNFGPDVWWRVSE